MADPQTDTARATTDRGNQNRATDARGQVSAAPSALVQRQYYPISPEEQVGRLDLQAVLRRLRLVEDAVRVASPQAYMKLVRERDLLLRRYAQLQAKPQGEEFSPVELPTSARTRPRGSAETKVPSRKRGRILAATKLLDRAKKASLAGDHDKAIRILDTLVAGLERRASDRAFEEKHRHLTGLTRTYTRELFIAARSAPKALRDRYRSGLKPSESTWQYEMNRFAAGQEVLEVVVGDREPGEAKVAKGFDALAEPILITMAAVAAAAVAIGGAAYLINALPPITAGAAEALVWEWSSIFLKGGNAALLAEVQYLAQTQSGRRVLEVVRGLLPEMIRSARNVQESRYLHALAVAIEASLKP